jgi:uncharacterized protein (TIGR03435 family)
MMRLILSLILAFAQAHPQFEVASIKPASEQIQQLGVGLRIDGSQVRLASLSLKDDIAIAYRLRLDQIVAPDWLSSQRFDIAAKLPEGSPQSQVPEMLQALIADRFQMKSHREMRDFPVYALGVAKSGMKMTALPPDPDLDNRAGQPINIAASGSGNGVGIDLGGGQLFTLGQTTLEVKRLTMSTFADMLTRFSDRPVVNMTELPGRYDFTLELTPEDRTAMLIRSAISAGVILPPQALRALDFGSTESLSSSLQKLGLTFEARKAPLEVLVIDSIQKTPTEN